MTIILKTLFDLWRERLAYLERRREQGLPEHHHHSVERRILRFCLHHYADSPHAQPPASAEKLDDESARRSNRLFLGEVEPRKVKAIVRDPAAQEQEAIKNELESLKAEVASLKAEL